MSTPGNKTYAIEIEVEQARACAKQFIDDLIAQWPDPTEAENVAISKSTVLDRQFIRDDLIPRIEGNDDINWLLANEIRITVKSSLQQFYEQGLIRIQILEADDKRRWEWWRTH